jgi:hypothetical protein
MQKWRGVYYWQVIFIIQTLSAQPKPGSSRIPFINLDKELAAFATINLIKCDIEGSEFDFIDNYPDLLKKTRATVYEFHRYGLNLDDARGKLARYGFNGHSVLRDTDSYCIQFCARAL